MWFCPSSYQLNSNPFAREQFSFSIKYENIKFYPVSYLLTNGHLYSLGHSAKSKYKKIFFYAIKDMKLVLAVGKCVQKHGVSELYNMSPVCLPLKLFPSEQIHIVCVLEWV